MEASLETTAQGGGLPGFAAESSMHSTGRCFAPFEVEVVQLVIESAGCCLMGKAV